MVWCNTTCSSEAKDDNALSHGLPLEKRLHPEDALVSLHARVRRGREAMREIERKEEDLVTF